MKLDLTTEREIQSRILNTLARGAVRLFRQNVGLAWHGRKLTWAKGRRQLIIDDPRPIHCGLVKGSGDLIGWRVVEITPEMVGQRVALFVSLEVKGPTGRGTKEQQAFVGVVNQAGGRAGFVRTVEEAALILGVDTPR